MHGFTPVSSVQLNINAIGKDGDGHHVNEGYFASGAEVHWGRRLVRLPIVGEADGLPVLIPMENVVQLTEPEPEHKCEKCGDRFAVPNALAVHVKHCKPVR